MRLTVTLSPSGENHQDDYRTTITDCTAFHSLRIDSQEYDASVGILIYTARQARALIHELEVIERAALTRDGNPRMTEHSS